VERDRRQLTIPRWAVAATGYALLIGAWAFASPPGAAPDEPAHAVRAAAAGDYQWAGSPVAPYKRTSGLSPEQAEFLNQQTQQFMIPARLVLAEPCFTSEPDASADCARGARAPADSTVVPVTTYATTALPFVYVLPGLAMRVEQDVLQPAYMGRLALGFVCALLLAAAAWAASRRGSLWPAVGLALGATPMVVFLASSLTPAGVAVCAAICFGSAVFALWLDRPRYGHLLLVALSGVALALTRPSGLAYMAAVMVAAVPLLRIWFWRPLVLLPFFVAAGGGLIELNWILNHQPSLPMGGSSVLDALPVVAQLAPDLAGQVVGVFGRADVPLPPVLAAVWEVVVVLLLATALVIGRWRDRFALLLATGAAVLLAAAVYSVILSPLGWDLQGRYVLAPVALLAILSGFVVHQAGLRPRLDAPLVGLVAAGLQFAAFWVNARRYAVGRSGPLDFVGAAQWSPPGGWLMWLLVAGLGAAFIALSMTPLTAAERAEADGPALIGDAGMVSVSR